MEILYIVSIVFLSVAISLGVGSSTIAVSNFFVAIADGTIDPSERRIMGVTYWVLRAAMFLILVTFVVQILFGGVDFPTVYYATTTMYAVALTIIVLYTNAILMTKRIMPSNFGPAIQAGSWYTLGVVAAISTIGMIDYSFTVFIFAYATAIAAFVALINLLMHYLKNRKTSS